MAIETTLSVRNAPLVVEWHNRREKYSAFEKHIDPNGVHEIWRDAELQDVYDELFGDAVKEYNNRQTRADRKIENYYQNVCADTRGKLNAELQKLVDKYKKQGRSTAGIKVKGKHPAYELIVGIGSSEFDRDEDGKVIRSDDEYAKPLQSKRIDEETGKNILMDYVLGWEKRNPNLELYGIYYHADEAGVPHIHCDFVPWAGGFKQGMKKQTSINKALEAQGFFVTPEMEKEREDYIKANPGVYVPQMNAYTLWQEAEREALAEICGQYGFTKINTPTRDKKEKVHHKDSAEYREFQGLQDAIANANEDYGQLVTLNSHMQRENKALAEKAEEHREELGGLTEWERQLGEREEAVTKREKAVKNTQNAVIAAIKKLDPDAREYMEIAGVYDGYAEYLEKKLTPVVAAAVQEQGEHDNIYTQRLKRIKANQKDEIARNQKSKDFSPSF